ncbi:MAG: YgeY family selenium metabolism-linked hydrolase [Candidatus Verstraetearchaeota archaeon]|nr:YgeY family selenium metabolism-linked hydrolase [Candidatus Verstraetearchaeota archaeon]
MMSVRGKVFEHIDSERDRLVKSTVRFIRTPSLSGSEGDVAKVLAEELKTAGLDVQVDPVGNVIGVLRGKGGASRGRRLAFNVHLDHVPAGAPELWTHDPFKGTVEDGKIYGRGAADTKGAWAPMILAMEAVKACGGIRSDVLFTAVIMEELTYSIGMRILLDSTLKETRPDYIVSGEATSLNVAVGHRGRTELEITTKGRSCHASAPWRGENAIYKAAPVISSVERSSKELESEEAHPLLGRSSLALTDITCSPGAHNVVPEYCRMWLDYRFLPTETLETISSKIRGGLKANNADAEVRVCEEEETTYTGVKFKGQKYMPAYAIDAHHPLVRMVAESAEAILSKPPKIQRWDFATDGGYSMGVLGIPTVGFSPCEENLTHAPNEYVRIDYMSKAAKVYAEIIMRLCRSD